MKLSEPPGRPLLIEVLAIPENPTNVILPCACIVRLLAATDGAVKLTLVGVKKVKSDAVPTPPIVVPVAGLDV